jgi:hypothetical protein
MGQFVTSEQNSEMGQTGQFVTSEQNSEQKPLQKPLEISSLALSDRLVFVMGKNGLVVAITRGKFILLS